MTAVVFVLVAVHPEALECHFPFLSASRGLPVAWLQAVISASALLVLTRSGGVAVVVARSSHYPISAWRLQIRRKGTSFVIKIKTESDKETKKSLIRRNPRYKTVQELSK